MAKGDVVSNLVSTAAAAVLDYQPAAGVEALINHVFAGITGGNAPLATIKLYDGSIVSTLGTHAAANLVPFRILVNNTRYLRIINNSVDTQVLGFTGIQTK